MSIHIQYCCNFCDWEDAKYDDIILPKCINCKKHFCKEHGRISWDNKDEGICDNCWDDGERFD